jgi:hypothetical protein
MPTNNLPIGTQQAEQAEARVIQLPISECREGYIPVLCTTCDPPAMVHVQVGVEIPNPYICTTCQKRALRRLQNATSPWVGRMGHGGGDRKGDRP